MHRKTSLQESYHTRASIGDQGPTKQEASSQIINEFGKKSSQNVINQRLAFRIQPNPVAPMNDEQIDVVANTIMDAINYAAALDLDR